MRMRKSDTILRMAQARHRLSIVVEPDVYQQLKLITRLEDRTMTAIVQRALAFYARRYVPPVSEAEEPRCEQCGQPQDRAIHAFGHCAFVAAPSEAR